MNLIVVLICLALVIVIVSSCVPLRWWSKLFGVEHFEEVYIFKKPKTGHEIHYLFEDLEFYLHAGIYRKKLRVNNREISQYSICPKDFVDDENQWTKWSFMSPLQKDFSRDEYDVRFRDVVMISAVCGDLDFAVCSLDSDFFVGDQKYDCVVITGRDRVKFPFIKCKLRSEKRFLSYVVASLDEVVKDFES